MTNERKTVEETTLGPISYENWKAQLKGNSIMEAYEFPLFTDAHITGEITEDYGPYQFLNTVAIFKQGTIAPSIILRVNEYLKEDPTIPIMSKTDTDRYHGGWLVDEIAALMSLCLGIRLKAGGCTRSFKAGGDPRGRPEMYSLNLDPVLVKRQGFLPVLPNAIGTRCINDAILVKSYCELSPLDAISLIRAARLYQDALWIAESEPELAWLLFVSSIETAADHWKRSKESPVERLKSFDSSLVDTLRQYGGEALVNVVADAVSNVVGSTKKFIDFLTSYLPLPPDVRPDSFAQHPWEMEAFRESFKIIYTWRSKALHGGVSFPLPMCESPIRFGNAFGERPVGLATSTKGAVWVAKDTPMLLHTFEYLVRNALTKWWESLCQEKGT
jgi:hypothetical protein